MNSIYDFLKGYKNFILLGESGCGKSEIALNLAVALASENKEMEGLPIDLFDMDQTKPLFRSRDLSEDFQRKGIAIHYQEQYLDSPQAVGGVNASLADSSRYTILDVGGDKNGALLIGAYQGHTNRDDSLAIYVVNSYRPWSKDIMAIDATLSSILAACHIQKFHIMANPNLGHGTTLEEWTEGLARTHEMLDPYVSIEVLAIPEGCTDSAGSPTLEGRTDSAGSPIPEGRTDSAGSPTPEGCTDSAGSPIPEGRTCPGGVSSDPKGENPIPEGLPVLEIHNYISYGF